MIKGKKIKNAGKGKITEKFFRKIRSLWVIRLRNKSLYKLCYSSYWHSIFFGHKHNENTDLKNFFTAKPNPGAGIGHQMANWIAGYWFAIQFDLEFAHIPFSNDKWEYFFGFYQNEVTVDELKKSGYQIIRLPLFDEYNANEVRTIQEIIKSYKNRKVVFLAEQDQFYHDQFGVMEDIQKKFYSAPARKHDNLIYNHNFYNVAIHVRRGDIVENTDKLNENIFMRFQSNEYFVQALKTALDYMEDKKNIHIYLFSQGKESDFPEFNTFPNMHYCLEMGAQDSFLHMVYADALITSKSSFSYKPALLNRGIKFCPADFWHGYPKREDWVLLDEEGMRKL